MMTPTYSAYLLACLVPQGAGQENPNPHTSAAAIVGLLDANGDGRVDRFEAAEAAMAWVDQASGPDGEGATPDGLLAIARERARGGSQGSNAAAPGARDADAWFTELSQDGNRYLDPAELAKAFPGDSWRLFDLDADGYLGTSEFKAATEAQTASATFRVDGTSAQLRGVIDASTPGRLLRLILEEPDVTEVVFEYMPGVADGAFGARTASLLATSGLDVRIPRGALVAPGAVAVFRGATRRFVEPGASILKPAPEGAAAEPGLTMTEDEIFRAGLRNEAETLRIFETGSRASLRGLAGVSSQVAWATGSGATVLRTIDGGASFDNVAPASIQGLDVRDVHALSEDIAWILTAGPGDASRILFTSDGGATWAEQHRETAPQAFLDGLDAWDAQTLIAYGDPMEDGRFRVLATRDGGATWTPSTTGPLALESGEASFAASGTGVLSHGALRAWIVTGGTRDTGRVFWSEDQGASWTAAPTPVASGTQGSGIFSIAMRNDGRGVVVGGDFMDRTAGGTGNAAFTEDFGKTWSAPVQGPRGQRAGSAALGNGWFLATGQTGTDISRDGGRTWRALSSEGFHCVDSAVGDGSVWFAGPRGRVARLR